MNILKVIGSIGAVFLGVLAVDTTINDAQNHDKEDTNYEFSYRPLNAQEIILKMKLLNDTLEKENESLALQKRVRLNTIKQDSVDKEILIKEKVKEITSLNLERDNLIKEKEKLLQRNRDLNSQIQKEKEDPSPGFFQKIFGIKPQ